MQSYLEPVEDGLPVRECGAWTAAKLDYVGRYIDAFETAIRSKFRTRCYIDLFAGPGKNRVRESGDVLLGSPLRAATTTYPFTHYYYVDADPENIGALRQRCTATPQGYQVSTWVGDCNQHVMDVVANLMLHVSAISLAFLDPQAFELKWQTVERLAQIARMDLIIYYPDMALQRYMRQACESCDVTVIDDFFGTFDWRRVFKDCSGSGRAILHRELIDLYKDRLRGLGYKDVLQPGVVFGNEPLMRNGKGAPLYRLLFASKNSLGYKLWQAVTRRDVHGQIRLFQ